MNILITGSRGFIARNLINRLSKFADVDVFFYDLPQSDISTTLDYPTDLDIVIHLAAETSIINSFDSVDKIITTNILGTYNILSNTNAKKFIFISSCAALNPLTSPYSMSKYIGEYLCSLFKSKMSIDIIRPSNIYGPYSVHKESVVAKFIKQSINNEPLTIRGDGSQTRSFIFVEDVITHIVSAIVSTNNYTNKSLFGTSLSVSELAAKICMLSTELLNYTPNLLYLNNMQEVNNTEYGEQNCLTDIDKGLTTTFKWFKRNYGIK